MKRRYDEARRIPDGDDGDDGDDPCDEESVIELARFLAAELDRKRRSVRLAVFFDVARVVREHDEADADDGGCRPDEHHGFEAKRENLKARERNEAAHDDAADRFSDGEV